MNNKKTAIANGVVKLNKDTHYQMDIAAAVQAYWEKEKDAIVCPPDVSPDVYMPDKNRFDPRKWLIKAEQRMQNTVQIFCLMSGSADNSILL